MKTLTLIASALFVLVSAIPASAQTWIETRTFTAEGNTTPRIDAWLSGQVHGKVGTFAWLQADKGYAEGYLGLSVSPKSWLQFGAGGGVEQANSPGRFGSFVWLGAKHHSAIVIFEDGGSGKWWKAEYTWQATRQVGVGLITERFKGSGIRVQVAIPKSPITIWAAP